jgi:hypothetical protein
VCTPTLVLAPAAGVWQQEDLRLTATAAVAQHGTLPQAHFSGSGYRICDNLTFDYCNGTFCASAALAAFTLAAALACTRCSLVCQQGSAVGDYEQDC